MNLLGKISQWYLKKQLTKEQKNQMSSQLKTNIQVRTNLKKLYTFVNWLNTKGIGNRHQRKIFWRKVINGEPLAEKVIKGLIDTYDKKISVSTVSKKEQQRSLETGYSKTKPINSNEKNTN